jgi:hypothetical protein
LLVFVAPVLRCISLYARVEGEDFVANIMNFPGIIFAGSFLILWTAARIGDFLRRRRHPLKDSDRQDVSLVLTANFTLLGLIVGFTFSMAVSRYDLRKTLEEQEANAIGTAYVRADLIGEPSASALRQALKAYLDLRLRYYATSNENDIAAINSDTVRSQAELWSLVSGQARANPNPVNALVVSGVNDVLNSQSFTQAARWNRIPLAAWLLMLVIALVCNILVGYDAHRSDLVLFLVVPIALGTAFFLIADIDSPTGGVIRIAPQNLDKLRLDMQHAL